ncbi:MAG TPA: hypothetical protein VFA45_01930, partial [Actinomycetes bacterium]|nr:hypothetical protein [Actinomycetes bacterium]
MLVCVRVPAQISEETVFSNPIVTYIADLLAPRVRQIKASKGIVIWMVVEVSAGAADGLVDENPSPL